MEGNIFSFSSLLDGLKNGSNPEALPLRGRPPYPDWVDNLDARFSSKSHFQALRKKYMGSNCLAESLFRLTIPPILINVLTPFCF